MEALRTVGLACVVGAVVAFAVACADSQSEKTAGTGGEAGETSAGGSSNEAGNSGDTGSSTAGAGGEGGETSAGGRSNEAGNSGDAGSSTAGAGGGETVECGYCERGCCVGDPHIVTHDGTYFDFQTAGEYVLTQGGDLSVQVRLVPTDLCGDIARTTAVALGSAETEVSIHADSKSFLRFGDGRTFAFDEIDGVELKDWTFSSGCEGIVATSAAGDVVIVKIADTQWLDVEVRPSAVTFEAGLTGLLGNGNGDTDDDLALADGTGLGLSPHWSVLHGQFADDWRIDTTASHFVYEDGETADDFAEYEKATLFDLRSAAEAELALGNNACEGVAEGVLHDACVTDVVCGGADASIAAEWFLADLQPEAIAVVDWSPLVDSSVVAVTCEDPGDGSTVTDTLTLNHVSACNYFRDSETVDISLENLVDGEPSGSSYMRLVLTSLTGTGTYTTDPIDESGTSLVVTADSGLCNGVTTLAAGGDCTVPPGTSCEITVEQTNLDTLDVSGAGSRYDGRIRLRITCSEALASACVGADTYTASNWPSLSVLLDITDCAAGL